ncbi:MAG: ribosome small subunit-dependent GTPase A, partial [Candidatus Paceibacterota bacterium]
MNHEITMARVIAGYKGAYKVKNSTGEYLAKITGKQMFEALSKEDYPAVGDWVEIVMADKENAVIQKILPRKTIIKRKSNNKNETQIIATNIDVAFVVESVDRDFSLNRFERYFALAENGGVKPAIILNKIDLLSAEGLDQKITELKNRFPRLDIIKASAVNNKGLDELKGYISKDKTYCFLGSSGVGKSSLINKLLNQTAIKTDNISSYSGRGKHVTTARQMYFLENGGVVIDNPGMREVGLTDVGKGIDTFFDDIAGLAQKCQYADCTHTHEPGCEVVGAVKSGTVDKDKYSNYLNLKKEAEYYEMNDVEKRKKDRQFGKFKKNALKE